MKIKITSNGDSFGTQIVNAETGEVIEYVKAVGWYHEAGELPRVLLSVNNLLNAKRLPWRTF